MKVAFLCLKVKFILQKAFQNLPHGILVLSQIESMVTHVVEDIIDEGWKQGWGIGETKRLN